MEEFAAALAPAKLLVVRASHGAISDSVWDLERPAVPVGTTLLGAAASSHHLRRNSSEGHVGKGVAYPPERVFDADRLLSALEALRAGRLTKGGVARAKGLFHTTAGWLVREIAGGRLTTAETSWRRDSRVDVILKDPETGEGETGKTGKTGDFFEWERVLADALVPADAPLLMLEDGKGATRAFDPRGFAALSHSLSKKIFSSSFPPSPSPAAAFRLGDVMAHAGLAREAEWMWIVMDAGLFGVGGPRRVLENGIIFPGEEGFRFVLPDEEARGTEDEVDACRDLTNVCGVRLAEAPGAAEGASA